MDIHKLTSSSYKILYIGTTKRDSAPRFGKNKDFILNEGKSNFADKEARN